MRLPRVSVLFPVHNGARYLRYALESILNQTFSDFEIEILNDGSTDESAAIIRSYRDTRIRYADQSRAGLTVSLNRLLDRARGTYLARMDHDDWSHPDRLEAQVAFFDARPDTVLVGSWIEVMDTDNRICDRIRYPITPSGIREAMLFSNPIAHGSVMLRRVPELGYSTDFDDAEDFDHWERLARRYPVANIPRFLYRWRLNPDGMSQSRSEPQRQTAERVLSRHRLWYVSRVAELAPTVEELVAERRATGIASVMKRKLMLMGLFRSLGAGDAWRRKLWDALRLPFLR